MFHFLNIDFDFDLPPNSSPHLLISSSFSPPNSKLLTLNSQHTNAVPNQQNTN